MVVTTQDPTSAVRTESILLVEDDDFSNQLIEMYLRKVGFTAITTAKDGREALETARSGSFDLILLDLNLPRLNGAEVLRRLRKNDVLDRTAVLVISSLTNVEDTAQCMELGAEDYLPKPFNRQLLENRVLSLLDRRRLRRQVQALEESAGRCRAVGSALLAAHQAAGLNLLPSSAAGFRLEGQRVNGGLATVLFQDESRLILFSGQSGRAGDDCGPLVLYARQFLETAVNRLGKAVDLKALLSDLDLDLKAQFGSDTRLAVGLAAVDVANGTMHQALAGMPPAALLRNDGTLPALAPVGSPLGDSGLPLYADGGIAIREQPLEGSWGVAMFNAGFSRCLDGNVARWIAGPTDPQGLTDAWKAALGPSPAEDAAFVSVRTDSP